MKLRTHVILRSAGVIERGTVAGLIDPLVIRFVGDVQDLGRKLERIREFERHGRIQVCSGVCTFQIVVVAPRHIRQETVTVRKRQAAHEEIVFIVQGKVMRRLRQAQEVLGIDHNTTLVDIVQFGIDIGKVCIDTEIAPETWQERERLLVADLETEQIAARRIEGRPEFPQGGGRITFRRRLASGRAGIDANLVGDVQPGFVILQGLAEVLHEGFNIFLEHGQRQQRFVGKIVLKSQIVSFSLGRLQLGIAGADGSCTARYADVSIRP